MANIFLYSRWNTLILGILDTLGILGICLRTEAVKYKQNDYINLYGSGLSGLGILTDYSFYVFKR
jgi:hypothetical protein